jgi:glucose/arabinose dehydrogenase
MRRLLALFLLTFLLTAGCQESPVVTPPEDDPAPAVETETQQEPQETTEPSAEPETPPMEEPVNEGPSYEQATPDLPEAFEPGTYALEPLFPGLAFDEPLAVVHDGIDALHVVERGGRIHRLPDDPELMPELLIDLSDRVTTSGQEQGLLGLAFHPDYAENGYFFVNYTRGDQTVIARFQAEGVYPVDPATEKVVLTYAQPYANHNGGTLLFGADGLLYIASGDGGAGGDPQGNAQDLGSLLGKLLRIDVDTEEEPYLVPEANPFVDTEGARPEIFAYGLRNPWKFSFDEGRDLLIAADVGQGAIEEIDLIEKGGNYGWNILEGSRPYSGDPEDLEDHILPLYDYTHDEGRSITGGYTYYGEGVPDLTGVYIYGDFISGRIWGLWIDGQENVENHELLDTDLMIASFGRDGNGEILVVDFNGGLYRMIAGESQ